MSTAVEDIGEIIEDARLLEGTLKRVAQMAQRAFANLDALMNYSEVDPFTSEDARAQAQEVLKEIDCMKLYLGGHEP